MKTQKTMTAILISLLILSPAVSASLKQVLADSGEDGSVIIFGWELEAVISVASSVLAIFLLVISYLAYKRERRKRLLFVLTAFSLFAVKGILYAVYEIFHPETISLEPIALLFDLAILLVLFVGIIKE